MGGVNVYWIVTGLLLFSTGACQAESHIYPFGPDAGDSVFTDSDDGAPPPINVTEYKFRYYNSVDEQIYINANGVVSFGKTFPEFEPHVLPYMPEYLEPRKFIAPFWADHFIGYGGSIWYRMVTEVPITMRMRAHNEIKHQFRKCTKHFKPKNVLIVTYSNVSAWENIENEYYAYVYTEYGGEEEEEMYYKRSLDENDHKVRSQQSEVRIRRNYVYPAYDYTDYNGQNTYQLVLVTDGVNTYAILNYLQVDWTVSDFDPAVVGFDAGDRVRAYMHPFSETSDLHTLASDSNVGVPGRWMYKISDGVILGPGCTPL